MANRATQVPYGTIARPYNATTWMRERVEDDKRELMVKDLVFAKLKQMLKEDKLYEQFMVD